MAEGERLHGGEGARAEPFGEGRHAAPGDHPGLPGDASMVVLLYLGLNWLILERLTLPDLFSEEQRHDLVATLVDRLLAGEAGGR
ncbi:hypothetical protein [Streptomyces cuspidosporus]